MNAPARNLRPARRAAPPAPPFEIVVCRTIDQIMQAMSVRTLAFMGDQDCPYEEEFDGNDFAGATHLLLKVNGQPAGTARVRWFGEFAKLERVAVTSAWRGEQFAIPLMRFAAQMAERKGFTKLLAHAQPALLPYWQAMFKGEYVVEPRRDRNGFAFSDHEYVEIVVELRPCPTALSLQDSPLRLNRPEGEWDRQGVLERSIRRGVTNPMRKRKAA